MAIACVYHHDCYAQDLEYKDGIIAVVNDEAITAYDVSVFNADEEKKVRAKYSNKDMNSSEIQDQFLEEINSNRLEAVNELVNQKLIYAEFEKKGYQLPVELVDKRIDSITASQAGGDQVKFEEMLAASNTTLEEFRDRIKKNIAVELLISQTIDRNINISPDSIEMYYRDHIEEFTTPAKIRLAVIALERMPTEAVKDHHQRGESILAELQAGADFSTLAKHYSDLPNKGKGGDLGWMQLSDVRQEFKKGLKTVAQGKISGLIDLNGTLYIIKVSDMEQEVTETLDDIYNLIKTRLFASEKKRRYQEYVSDLRSKSYVRLFFKE